MAQQYRELGEQGLIGRKPIANTHPNGTLDQIIEKILHLRKKYHFGPIRIMWYTARYHDLKVSDAIIYRVLRRHSVSHIIEKFPFKIQQIRTDRGQEFQSQFHWHVEDLGIPHVYIKTRTPQINGKIERSHRSDQQEFYCSPSGPMEPKLGIA